MNIIDALLEVLKDSPPNAALTKADIARAKALLPTPAAIPAPAAPAAGDAPKA
jgi:hypothetical protein